MTNARESVPELPDPALSHVKMVGGPPVSRLSIGDLLRTVAAEVPDGLAIKEPTVDGAPGRTWTYAQLLAEAEAGARGLLEHFAPGEHVAIWCANCPEWVVVQFAVALAGLVLVAANPGNRATETEYVLRQSDSVGVIYNRRFRDVDAEAIIASLAPKLPKLRVMLTMDRWAELVANAPAKRDLPKPDCTSAAMIQYTSGTTGAPKGAVLPHLSLVNCGRFSAAGLNLRPFPKWYIAVPLFHTGGCVFGVLGSLWQRGTLIIATEFDPHKMLDAIAIDGANGGTLVPTMCLRLLEAQSQRPRDVKNLEVIVGGGASVPPELVRRLERELGCEFVMVFGQTETGSAVTQSLRGDTERNRTETLGRVFPHLEARIADPDTNQTVPLGEHGEILLRGHMAFLEYHAMPAESAATLDKDGWLHTGDLGALDALGYVTISGRIKDTIIRGGEKIFPREVEAVLAAHPSVAESAIFGVPDALWGEAAVAAIRLREGAKETPETISTWLRERVARYKVPLHVTFVTEYPLTPSGKVQKFVLREAMIAKLTAAK